MRYKVTAAILGTMLFGVGLLAIFRPNLSYIVQFDLFQGFLYAVTGAIGLKLAFGRHSVGARWYYVRGVGIGGVLLLLLGLTFPNFKDILHLEIPEHVFHAVIGIGALFASDRGLSVS